MILHVFPLWYKGLDTPSRLLLILFPMKFLQTNKLQSDEFSPTERFH